MEYPNWTRDRQYTVDLQLAKERMSEQRMDRTELRGELIDWITKYKDAAERNALAEDPDESADYLIALMDPLIEEAKKQEGERITLIIDSEIKNCEAKILKRIKHTLKEGK